MYFLGVLPTLVSFVYLQKMFHVPPGVHAPPVVQVHQGCMYSWLRATALFLLMPKEPLSIDSVKSIEELENCNQVFP